MRRFALGSFLACVLACSSNGAQRTSPGGAPVVPPPARPDVSANVPLDAAPPDAAAPAVPPDAAAPAAPPDATAPAAQGKGTTAVTSETQKIRVRFTARVESVRMLSEFAGTAKPVHVDPRFALILRVTEVAPEGMGIAARAREVFLIHSVAKLFRSGGMQDSVGGEFEFSVERRKTPNGVRWAALRVEAAR